MIERESVRELCQCAEAAQERKQQEIMWRKKLQNQRQRKKSPWYRKRLQKTRMTKRKMELLRVTKQEQ